MFSEKAAFMPPFFVAEKTEMIELQA